MTIAEKLLTVLGQPQGVTPTTKYHLISSSYLGPSSSAGQPLVYDSVANTMAVDTANPFSSIGYGLAWNTDLGFACMNRQNDPPIFYAKTPGGAVQVVTQSIGASNGFIIPGMLAGQTVQPTIYLAVNTTGATGSQKYTFDPVARTFTALGPTFQGGVQRNSGMSATGQYVVSTTNASSYTAASAQYFSNPNNAPISLGSIGVALQGVRFLTPTRAVLYGGTSSSVPNAVSIYNFTPSGATLGASVAVTNSAFAAFDVSPDQRWIVCTGPTASTPIADFIRIDGPTTLTPVSPPAVVNSATTAASFSSDGKFCFVFSRANGNPVYVFDMTGDTPLMILAGSPVASICYGGVCLT